jgi:hypothetical protein
MMICESWMIPPPARIAKRGQLQHAKPPTSHALDRPSRAEPSDVLRRSTQGAPDQEQPDHAKVDGLPTPHVGHCSSSVADHADGSRSVRFE